MMILHYLTFYYFQAPCQVELDNWVNSIHSACAAAFARHRGKTGTLHLLQVCIQKTYFFSLLSVSELSRLTNNSPLTTVGGSDFILTDWENLQYRNFTTILFFTFYWLKLCIEQKLLDDGDSFCVGW